MADYELLVTTVATSVPHAEHVERWLEDIARRGGRLVTFMPTTDVNRVAAVFVRGAPGPGNYEVAATAVPSGAAHAEYIERWLEQHTASGFELVAFMPTTNAGAVVAVFRA